VDLLINLPHFLQLLASEQKLYVCLAHGKIRVSICDFEAFGSGYALKKKKKKKKKGKQREQLVVWKEATQALRRCEF
jgi:hypothetical protein